MQVQFCLMNSIDEEVDHFDADMPEVTEDQANHTLKQHYNGVLGHGTSYKVEFLGQIDNKQHYLIVHAEDYVTAKLLGFITQLP